MRYAVFLILLSVSVLCGCKVMPKKTTNIHTPEVTITHDPEISSPPEVHVSRTEEAIQVPAGSKITVKETESTESSPSIRETVIELPKDHGTEIKTVNVKTDASGSKGFEPEKGATPTEKANAAWTYVGIGVCALGIFFCTPWGGSNFRVGALIAAGGIGMSIIGKFIDQIKIPAPAMAFIFIGLAVAVYYGYRVRHKQSELETP